MSQDPVTRAQQRENEDPEEAIRPMPLSALLVAVAMVLWAVVYILYTEPLDLSQWGDQRTRAELSGPAPAAPGAAVDGKALFAAQCAACHQATGLGLPGVCVGLTTGSSAHTLNEFINISPVRKGLTQVVNLVQSVFRELA